MYSYLFHNRWIAAVWVAFMLISAVAFVSEGGGQQKLDAAAAKIREDRQKQIAAPPPSYPEAFEANAGVEIPGDPDAYIVSEHSVYVQSASDEEVAPAM